ncbi:hypothetical protein [Rhizobium leguminosarum]|uniref:hypothetical protein n=1 Tax=Rhizobium leguminosarum TaxID=384 RepID=UPI0013E97480|nr:hypothetical protein [Rhizobium leguminosarum]
MKYDDESKKGGRRHEIEITDEVIEADGCRATMGEELPKDMFSPWPFAPSWWR